MLLLFPTNYKMTDTYSWFTKDTLTFAKFDLAPILILSCCNLSFFLFFVLQEFRLKKKLSTSTFFRFFRMSEHSERVQNGTDMLPTFLVTKWQISRFISNLYCCTIHQMNGIFSGFRTSIIRTMVISKY